MMSNKLSKVLLAFTSVIAFCQFSAAADVLELNLMKDKLFQCIQSYQAYQDIYRTNLQQETVNVQIEKISKGKEPKLGFFDKYGIQKKVSTEMMRNGLDPTKCVAEAKENYNAEYVNDFIKEFNKKQQPFLRDLITQFFVALDAIGQDIQQEEIAKFDIKLEKFKLLY